MTWSKGPTAAQANLNRAISGNYHVWRYLLGIKKLARWPPDSYQWGSIEAADLYARTGIPAWQAHPEAVEWLRIHAHVGPRKTG